MSHITLPDGRLLGTGDRIRVRGFIAAPEGTYSLAGMQPKLAGNLYDVTGEVMHLRGNHPIEPTSIGIFFKDTIQYGAMSTPLTKNECQSKHVGQQEYCLDYHPALSIEILFSAYGMPVTTSKEV